jgi:hypothetical protein
MRREKMAKNNWVSLFGFSPNFNDKIKNGRSLKFYIYEEGQLPFTKEVIEAAIQYNNLNAKIVNVWSWGNGKGEIRLHIWDVV